MDQERWNLFSPDEIRRTTPSAKPANDNLKIRSDRAERELDRISGASKPKRMTIPLQVLVPLLLQANENNHTWLTDFAEDMVEIDADLHEVLMAFQNLDRRRAA